MGTWIKNNFWAFFFGLFALIGTIMGAIASVVWQNTNTLIEKGVHTEGTVVRLLYNGKGSACPVVEYRTENGDTRTYSGNTYTNPPEYDEGEAVELWYNPDRPGEVVLAGVDRWLVPAILGGFFVIFGGIGFGGLLGQWLRQRRRDRLEDQGRPVEADIVSVYHNTSLKVGGASPFVIQCQWHDKTTNRVYTYDSDNLWYDPSPFLNGRKTVTALIDPKDPAAYHLDLSFLPQPGN